MTRASTASMGKFDRMLQGEKKPRGVKRKVSVHCTTYSFHPTFLTLFFFQFEPTEKSVEAEKSANLALIRKLEDSSKNAKRGGGDGSNILNVRKAVRFASRGEGAAALARKTASRADSSRQKWKGKR